MIAITPMLARSRYSCGCLIDLFQLSERAMTNQSRVWKHIKHSFTTWQDHAPACIKLSDLGDQTLRDIGLYRHNDRPNPPLPW